MHRRISAIALAIVLVTVCLRAQSVLNVPSSTHPTIQAAVTAAQAGDTIQIAPGNYLEAVVVTGKSLIIQGAGGQVTDWQNRPATRGGRVLATGDARLHETVLGMLAGA